MRNVILALRGLARNPIVTIVAALSLGLGIGSNAAIYSIFHLFMRQDLRVHEPDRLINFSAPGPKNGSSSCGSAGSCDDVFSLPMFRDLQRGKPAGLAAIAGHRDLNVHATFENNSYSERGLLVSGSYFPILGLKPFRGRLITPADDSIPGASPIVVLSYRFWEKLGADSSIVGKTLMLNGKPQTIAGVAPPLFEGTTIGNVPSFYVPLVNGGQIGNGIERYGFDDRRAYWIYAFARLTPSGTIDQARASLNAIYQPIIRDVEAPLQKGMRDSVLARFKEKQIVLKEGSHGQTDIGNDASGPLFMLFAITGLVLLIACANIANLLMARATGREMEMAVRLSLGATRRQLVWQLLTESLVLAVIGGVASLLFASWTLQGINALLPEEITSSLHLGVSWAAVGFAGLLSIATGVAFGMFPALHSTRPDLVTAMRNNSGKLSGGRTARRFRTSLATAQIALAMALLMSSGLFLKSLWQISRADLGVNVDHLVTFSLSPEASGYDSVRSRALFDRVEQELATIPGAVAVTSTMVPMIAGSNWNNGVRVEGYTPANSDENVSASFNAVDAGYFRAIDVDLLAGRDFSDGDISGRPKVAIVNEAFAKRFNLGANPVGKRMALGRSDTLPLNIEIVGLVRDFKYASVKRDIPPVFFRPHRQLGDVGEMNFYVRTDGDPSAIVRAIPPVVRRVDAMLPVDGLRTMPEEIRRNTFEDRMISTMSSAFALLATLLAAVGLYGVLAYSVAQRTREIGVRMALGANAPQVRALVLRQVGMMVLIGGTIGLAGAIALGKVAQSMLYRMSGADPVVMAAAIVTLSLVALAAGYVPALRASRVDPMQALRYE
jgi:predicted permease